MAFSTMGRAAMLAVALTGPGLGACGPGSDSAAEDPAQEELSAVYFPNRLTERAPDDFRVRLDTSEGVVVIEVHRSWSPNGADRFYNLVRNGYYDDARVYRVVPGFMAQFGVHADPVVTYQWRNSVIADDPVARSNERGRVSFAMGGPNSRINEVFINLRDNPALDDEGFSPIGEVVEGMDAVDAFYDGYGDGPPRGDGPYQARARAQGNEYLDAEFPALTRIRSAVVETG